MRTVTDRFQQAVRQPHAIMSSVDVYFPGETTPVTLPIEAGEVTIDRTAMIRRAGTVTVPWSLRDGADLGLDLRTLPLGGYVVPFRGVRYGDGSTETVQLGVLRVESVTWQTLEGSASLELADWMAQVRDEPFLAPYSPAAGTELTVTGTLANASAVVNSVTPNTTGLLAGMIVKGIGVPADTRVLSIGSSSQFTMDKPAKLTVSKVAPVIRAAYTWFEVDDTSELSVGMQVSTPGLDPWNQFPAGTVIVSVDSPTRVSVSHQFGINTIDDVNVTFTVASPVQPLTIGGGKRIASAVEEIVRQVFGSSLAFRRLYDPAIITSDVYYTGSRADAVLDLANAAAAVGYFDADGAFVFDQPPDLDADSVWTVDAGETGVLVDADEALDRTGVVNGVLVEGQRAADEAPVSALVVDDNPASPTFWGGPFGKVARVEQSSAVQTVAQAEDAAAMLLTRQLGLTRSLTLTAAPNPALEAADVIQVLFPDGRDERHIIDAVTVSLGTDAQQITTRGIYQAEG